MSAFDEVLVGAKKCFDFAAEKVCDGVDASKVYIEKAQLKVEIKDRFVKLGRLCYREKTSGIKNDAACEKLISEIGELKEKLAMADVKVPPKTKACPSCGAKNPIDGVFCTKCGEKM